MAASYLSAAETAITGVSRPRMHRLAQQGNRRAVLVNSLLERKDEVVSATLIGNSVLNIFAASLTTAVLTNLFGSAGVAYATIFVTVLVVLFVEVLPKTWALLHADRVALVLAPTLNGVLKVIGPVARAATRAARISLNLIGVRAQSQRSCPGPGRHAARRHRAARRRTGRRSRAGREGDAALRAQPRRPHRRRRHDPSRQRGADRRPPAGRSDRDPGAGAPDTRIPLYRDEPDNIVGIIHAKDLFRAAKAAPDVTTIDIGKVMTRPWFIPEATTLFGQLQAFRARHEHFAIVVDEYGGLRGIVTLEDIIEEIVGDIQDEHDPNVAGVIRREDGSFLCQGDVPIRDLNRESAGACPRTSPPPSPAWCCMRRGASPRSARPTPSTASVSRSSSAKARASPNCA